MTSPGFANPIAGGGILVQPGVQSPNFSIPGQTGWAIFANGNAYFFNITASGTITATSFAGTDFVINSAGSFFYSGTPAAGNLIASIASAVGTDGFGNVYLAGTASYSGSVALSLQGAELNYYQLIGGAWTQEGFISAGQFGMNITPINDNAQTFRVGAVSTRFAEAKFLAVQTLISSTSVTPGTSALLEVQGALAITTGGLTVTGGTSTDALTVSSGGANITGNSIVNGSFNVPGTSGAHFGVDTSGNIYMANASGNYMELGCNAGGDLLITASGGRGFVLIPAALQWGTVTSQLSADGTISLGEVASPATPTAAAKLYATSTAFPAGIVPSGLSGRMGLNTLADFTAVTVIQATPTQCTKAFTIPANDAEAGAHYILTAAGTGVQGTTAQALQFLSSFGGNSAGTGLSASTTVLPISAAFAWKLVLNAYCVTSGSAATWWVTAEVDVHNSTTGTLLFRGFGMNTSAVSVASNAAITWEGQADWAATTGAPTLTCHLSTFERMR